jgi:hypothetical protein
MNVRNSDIEKIGFQIIQHPNLLWRKKKWNLDVQYLDSF